MTELPLPALDGRTPLGFLAALGILRLTTDLTGHPARLSWSTSDCTAILHDAQPDHDTLTADLTAIVESIPNNGVLPQLGPTFPPPGEAPDKLRLSRADFTRYTWQVTHDDPAAEDWLGMLVTDLSLDDKQRTDITPYAAPSGKQSMRTMLEKPLADIRKNPALLHEALTSWRRYPGVTGEYLDHRVLFDAVDAPDGKPAERGVPGATWLALMAYPLFRTTAASGQSLSTCWQDCGPRIDRRMIYPLWSAPLDTASVQALLAHPILAGADSGTPPPEALLLSMFLVVHAARRRIPGRNFAGVLTPTTAPRTPARRKAQPW
ncbi:type I-G CRISPR-associated protein, Cas3-extension family [Actinoplanes regularis]|uniref:Uncharacterized protein n=1 Tax=Actinoplanes regularis TaxID=52697 RepID=A0A239IUB9_9ACTN|nr:hypothetical protein [Actinoplanes regularis]GIE91582.1 hypothetical protein Are01nite_80620 [Actinoplanes regularis]SNS97376.1 hypothetical protein SAMN06264365_13121 [Actinoplanes regularis]